MKKILVFLVAMTFMFSFVAAGTNDTIVKAADRIVALQYDGSWGWDVTGLSSYSGTVHRNIAGVNAEILLDAYELTRDNTYLNAAKATGNYIIGFSINSSNKYNSFNINFLYHLSEASGEASYKNHADDLMDHILNQENYFSSHNGNYCGTSAGDHVDGCTASELTDAIVNLRAWPDYPPWDLYGFVEAGQRYGNDSFANDMATEIKSYWDSLPTSPNDIDYILGLSGVILALEQADMDSSDYVDDLLDEQKSNGGFETPDPDYGTSKIASTAYALMALKAAGKTDAVSDAGAYLLAEFGYDSIDGWLEGNDKEYSEPTSEAAQALYDAIGSMTEVEGTLVDYFWTIKVTPSTLSFGTIPRGDPIAHPSTEDITVYTTGSDTQSGDVWVYVDVVEEGDFYTILLHLFVGSSWEKADTLTLVIPENDNKVYDVELRGSTLNTEPGPKEATIVYTAYGEPLP